LSTDFVDGTAIAKDEVDGALNVAVLEVMAAGVVTQGVLVAVESAPREVSLVP